MAAMFCLQRRLFPVPLSVKGRRDFMQVVFWCAKCQFLSWEIGFLLLSLLTGWVPLCVLHHCAPHLHCSGKTKYCNWLEKGSPLPFRNVLTSSWTFPDVVSDAPFKCIYLPYTFVILTLFWALGWLYMFLCIHVCVLKLNHSYCFLCGTRNAAPLPLLLYNQMSLPKICFLSFLFLHSHF